MTQMSNSDVVSIFKRVYGDLTDLLPEDYLLAKDIPFTEKQKTGESYNEAVVLTNETGWTLGGSGMDAVEINPAIAGAVKQATVSPFVSILASVIPWAVISRSHGGGDKAFVDATKHVVKNNLKSHGKLQEILRLYGQSASLLGYVSYATATYRDVSFTTGTGTLSINGTNVTFTNGVNTTSKWILFAPGEFAAGHWIGTEGAIVQQYNGSAVVGEGSLLEIDADKGAIRVDFTPVAASSATSHYIGFKGQPETKDMVGVHKILATSGSVFGISNATYSIWKGTRYSLGNRKLTFEKLGAGVALAVNRAGLDGDLKVYVNPRTWNTMLTTEAGLRSYDESYKSSKAENGAESITFHSQNGKLEIVAHRMVKEGHAFAMHLPDWSRSGSAEVSFKVPGVDKELIFPLENQTAYAFRTFTDQYIFCHAPARSILFDQINDESST